MNEPLLFPIPDELERSEGKTARFHRDDPETSRRAAEKLTKSGKHRTQRQATLEAVRRCPGATHAELGRFMGVDWFIPARRLSELERDGLVKKGAPRVCRVKGTWCTTWWTCEQSESKAQESSLDR